MGLWLLSFTQREVAVIVEAETLTHARLLAAANQICRASQFDEGVAIKPAFQPRIPADLIGRALSQDETADLLGMLTIRASEETASDQIETAAAAPRKAGPVERRFAGNANKPTRRCYRVLPATSTAAR
jgi:hypothetical protein